MNPMHVMTARRPASGPVLPAALREYRAVDLDARVATASPHQLIAMLFERLVTHLATAELAASQGQSGPRLLATEKALAIVDGLDMSLDEARGGDVARSLHQSYGLIRARLADGSAGALGEARLMVDRLADAWRRIAPAPGRQVGPERI